MVEDEPNVSSDSLQLEYTTPKSQNNKVSETTDTTYNLRQQHVNSNTPALNTFADSNNMFNMQLQYNINQALNSEFWDGNFHTILLHGSMEYLASDMKNIKKSLRRMQKFIFNKTIEGDKANDIKDLKGVSKAA